MCGLEDPAPPFPPTGEVPCCDGSAIYGYSRCTCWRPVYDCEQTPPRCTDARLIAAGVPANTRERMCTDCAYRPDAPERNGDPHFRGDAAHLERLAADGTPFWCHQGMRKVIAWRHPSGVEIPDAVGASYDPPPLAGVPWKADGTPGDMCAGWAARRRALAAKRQANADDGALLAGVTLTVIPLLLLMGV